MDSSASEQLAAALAEISRLREELRRQEEAQEALRRDRALLDQLLNTVPDKIYFKDLQSRFILNNRAHVRQFGLEDPAEVVGKSDADFFAESHARQAYAEEQEVIRTGVAIVGKEEKLTLSDGAVAWASTTKVPLRDPEGKIMGTFGISRDITRSKLAEAALTEERNLLRTLIDLLPTRIYVKDCEARYLINNIAHLRQIGVSRQEEATGKMTRDFFPGERGEQALADDRQVIDEGRSIIAKENSYVTEDGSRRWSLTTKVPLRDSEGKIVGLVGLSHDITERKHVEEELRRKNDEMRADLKVAYEIQQSFLTLHYPVFPLAARPEDSALRFNHRYFPASTLAGDFFEILRISDTEAGIVVCDVMGHGVRAALITAFLRGLVEEIISLAGNPGAFLTEINRGLAAVLRQADSPMFVTAFYAVADVTRGELRYANAGHPLPFVLRRSAGEVERLPGPGASPEPAAGLMDGFVYTSAQSRFSRGDLAILYTDGLFEVENAAGEMFGEDRLRANLEQRLSVPTKDLLDEITGTIKGYAGVRDFVDDVCIVTVEAVDGMS